MELIQFFIDVFWNNEVPDEIKWGLFISGLVLSLLFAFRHRLWNYFKYKFIFTSEQQLQILERCNFARHLTEEFERAFIPSHYVELDVLIRGGTKRLPLLRAIRRSKKSLLILEGGPGSGKTVGINRFAYELARKAEKSKSPTNPIPVHVNLRYLKPVGVNPRPDQVDRVLRAFILQSLNPHRRSDIAAFLQREFDPGLRTGAWIFIFDSFDEIPDVLIATQKDQVVQLYMDALDRFLGGVNACRGIVASRHYMGPDYPNWPILTIQPLNLRQRRQFIRKSDIPQAQHEEILARIEGSGNNFRLMAETPLFLSLLCKNIANQNEFPQNPHAVYSDYINDGLKKFDQTLQHQHHLDQERLLSVLELIAFTIIYKNLGLSPTRLQLYQALASSEHNTRTKVDKVLNAAVQIGLLFQTNLEDQSSDDAQVSFLHRRIQEFLATQFIIKNHDLPTAPHLVSATDLLSDGRWRDVTVALLQIQEAEKSGFLFDEVERFLKREFWNVVTDLSAEYDIQYWKSNFDVRLGLSETLRRDESFITRLSMAFDVQYVLEILRDGVAIKRQIIPETIDKICHFMIDAAYWQNSLEERLMALNYISLLSEEKKKEIIESFGSTISVKIIDATTEQATALNVLPLNIKIPIIQRMIGHIFSGSVWSGRRSIEADIYKLPLTSSEKSNLRSLKWIPIIDPVLILSATVIFLLCIRLLEFDQWAGWLWWGFGFLVISMYILLRSFGYWGKGEKIDNLIRSSFYFIRSVLAFLPALMGCTLIIVILVGSLIADPALFANGILSGVLLFIASWVVLVVPSIMILAEKLGITIPPTLWFLSPLLLVFHVIKKTFLDLFLKFNLIRQVISSLKLRISRNLTRAKQIYQALVSQPKQSMKLILEWLGAGLVIVVFVYGYMANFSGNKSGVQDSPLNFSLGIFFLSLILAVPIGFWYLQRRHDRILLEKRFSSISIDDFLTWLIPHHKDRTVSWQSSSSTILEIVLSSGKLVPTPQAVAIMNRLALLIQCSQNINAYRIIFTPTPNPDRTHDGFNQWLTDFQREGKMDLSSFGKNSLEELNLWLREYDQVTRSHTSYQPREP